MGFAQENGYTPRTIESIMNDLMNGVNAQFGKSFTTESFIGTNWYKYCYAIAQKIQAGEVKTSEAFLALQNYIEETNQQILRPTTTFPGLISAFAAKGWKIAIKPPAEVDAGKIFIAVDVDTAGDDYAAEKLEIAGLIRDYVDAALVTMGTEVQSLTLSNSQAFDFKFNPPDPTPILLRLTAVISENNMVTVPDDEEIRQQVFDQVNARYGLGKNFEPQRYFGLSDAPWAGEVTLEWSDDGGSTWNDDIYDAAYDELLTFGLEDIDVVVT